MPVNRGSIKEYREESEVRRPYGSSGEEYHNMNITHGEHRFSKFVSQTIEEDLYDS